MSAPRTQELVELLAESRATSQSKFAKRHRGIAFVVEPLFLGKQAGARSRRETETHVAAPRGEVEGGRAIASLHPKARVVWIAAPSSGSPANVRLGRDTACEVVVRDSKISRHHATIRPAEEGWVLVDNRSANGTSLNSRRLEPDVATPVADGDHVLLGGAVVVRPFFRAEVLYRLLRGEGQGPGAATDGEEARSRDPRKSAVRKLRRKRATEFLLSALDDLSQYGVVVADMAGRVVLCNKVGERVLGSGMGEVRPESWAGRFGLFRADTVTPLSPWDQPLVRALRGEATDHVEIFVRNPQVPEGLWIAASARPIRDDRGELAGAVIFFHDVTHLKRLEDYQRQEHKMEAIGRLAGGVAHDFNNLLTGINGHSELLLNRPATGERLRKGLEEIYKAGQRATSLTRQLLAFSRKSILRPRVLDLNRVVADMEAMLRKLIGEEIGLLVVRAKGLGRVRADPNQLEQVIMNLAANARDSMHHSSRKLLTLETQDADLDETSARELGAVAGPYVFLSLTDTGAGMDAATLAHVFEPFFTTKRLGQGTGLGLSTVYGIVRQSGGHVWVKSDVGNGTTFRVYLPRVQAELDDATPQVPIATASLRPRATETVLLVEDDEIVRSVALAALDETGYTVLAAADPAEAIAIAAKHPGAIELLVTDVVMPQMNGRQLYERLLASRPTMRVVYMSGYTEMAVVHQGVLEPGTVFLPKPFAADTLLKQVRAVLEQLGDKVAGARTGPRGDRP